MLKKFCPKCVSGRIFVPFGKSMVKEKGGVIRTSEMWGEVVQCAECGHVTDQPLEGNEILQKIILANRKSRPNRPIKAENPAMDPLAAKPLKDISNANCEVIRGKPKIKAAEIIRVDELPLPQVPAITAGLQAPQPPAEIRQEQVHLPGTSGP